MTRSIRNTSLAAALLAAGALVASGCGSDPTGCNLTPEVNRNGVAQSCTLQPETTVTVNVRWCSCGASTTCEVINAGGGVYQLEPRVNSCDDSCPPNPSDCPVDEVQCVFTTPASGNYNLYVISGQGYQTVPLTIGGTDTDC